MNYFEYTQEELDVLKSKCKTFTRYIDEIGFIQRGIIPGLYAALVNSIVGQQISTKAQATIWQRMQDRLGEITPENILLYSNEEIQSCGISMKKAGYIKEAAEKIISKELDLDALHFMSDAEVCRQLSQLKGIGVWTAEMLMIFSMQRKDIFSFDDIAILRGLRMVYRHRKITRELFEKYRRRFSPYASIASLYLWEISVGTCELKDCAPMTEAQKKIKRRQNARNKKSNNINPKNE
ncbi:MAG: DNA-3-methyladenine glycosylase family protein [Dysgonomonas mossii]|uniref:DNA-3-methyladenine glycosylase family protein n=1 Tax=Dysgonomonas mossii TaxID=163665 RepID=UPI00399461D3